MVYLLVVLLLLSGCAVPLPETHVEQYPQLIETAPLPPPPSWYHRSEMVLEMRIFVAADGSVRELAWLESSGDREWDARAKNAVLRWRYTPAIESGKPTGIWVRHTVKVRFEDLVAVPLAEIVCLTREVADSVYSLIDAGSNFGALAKEVSVGEEGRAGGFRGLTNIGVFPTAVREVLRHLREGEVTLPLPLGDRFVIFKRVALAESKKLGT